MFEILGYYARKRVRGAAALTVGIAILVGLYVWMFPTISGSVDLDEYIEAWPPALREAFGLEALGTIEGFLAGELYSFVWILLLGLYLAYLAASLIADDVERDRMDMLLSLPVSRARVVLEKFGSLLVPIVVVNAILPVVIYVGVTLIDESISVVDLLAVHLLSIPYLLTTAGIGLACSVYFNRASIAQRAAMGIVFGLFLVDSVVASTDYEWLGLISPTRHFDPTAVLVHSDYGLVGALVLSLVAIGLVAGSVAWFSRKDVY